MSFTSVAHDHITVSVIQTATAAKVIVKDVTRGKSQTYKGKKGFAGGTDNSNIGISAVLINNVQAGHPVFGTPTFAPDLTNGVAIGTLPHIAVNEVTSGGILQIKTTAFNTAGNSFKTIFKHA